LLAILGFASCSRSPLPVAGPSALPVFRDAAPETGLRFEHRNGASGDFLMPEIMGAGVALADFDGDGDLDVYFVQSQGTGRLYRNDLADGRLAFTDVTAASGIDYDGYGMGAATGDFDADGRTDLLITGWGQTRLYRNLGGNRFGRARDFPPVWSTSASFFDYNRDGRQDLIILTYVNFSRANNKKCQAPTGEPDYCTPRVYSPAPARLYRNEGGGRLTDVTDSAGFTKALGPGLGVAAHDFNGDGWTDLFIANDTAQNHVWLNQRDGTFRETGIESGAGYSEDGLAKAGMGVALGDYDQDGDLDLYVVNLMREGATLFRQEPTSPQGWPSFLDVTRQTGLYRLTLPFTGFGTAWIDYDNDGQLDLFMANGAVTLREEQRGQAQPFRERNLLLKNQGGRFADVSSTAGSAMALEEITRGAAFGDIDQDGDVDIVITNNNGPARLLLNQAPPRNWLQVELVTPQAHGAMVTVRRDGLPSLMRRVQTDSSYCSASPVRVHFGLGDTTPSAVEVLFPDGRREVWEKPAVQQILRLKPGSGRLISR
jgi:hypothetical protein